MAGNYPDPPGPRISYDADGTTLYILDSSLSTATPQANSVNITLNDDDPTGTSLYLASGQYLLFLFPQAMDITHWSRSGSTTTLNVEYSTNSTNGIDGTWASVAVPSPSASRAELRTNTVAVGMVGVVAFRVQRPPSANMYHYSLHLYGKPSATTNRLEFWHPTLDQPLSDTPAAYDYGNIVRGSGPVTKQFRIKNLSTTLTANTITIGCEAISDASPTFVSQTNFSYNGGSFATTASIATLAPTAISNVVTARLTTTTSTALSLWSQRYYAEANNWS